MHGIRDDYDAIIIGAGIGGLTCGSLLARNRMRVLVVEQASKTGGYCTTFEYKDYYFDIGLYYLTGCEPGGVIYRTLDDLGLGGSIEFAKLEPAIKIIGGDYEVKITSPESLEDRLVKLFPLESLAIRKLVNDSRDIAAEMKDLSTVSVDNMNIWTMIFFFITYMFKYGGIRRYRGKSLEEVVDKFIGEVSSRDDELRIRKLRSILFSTNPYLDPGMMAAIPMTLLGAGEGCYYPIGGAQTLADRLTEGLRKNYGDLLLNTMVDKILIENGKATGVVLSDGRLVRSRYIVSNADARQTFLKLVGEKYLPTKFKKNLEESWVSGSAFIVSLGVKSNLRTMGYDDAIIVYNPVDDPEELFGNNPDKCTVSITIHSITDPDLAWDSTTAVQLIAMLDYDAVDNWDAEQELIADKLIASAENVIPHLSDNILCRHVMTPLTLEQATLNSRGARMGWYPAPASSIRKQKTPITNLYQAGHWTYPGGGIPAVVTSGRNAAQLILGGKQFLKG